MVTSLPTFQPGTSYAYGLIYRTPEAGTYDSNDAKEMFIVAYFVDDVNDEQTVDIAAKSIHFHANPSMFIPYITFLCRVK